MNDPLERYGCLISIIVSLLLWLGIMALAWWAIG